MSDRLRELVTQWREEADASNRYVLMMRPDKRDDVAVAHNAKAAAKRKCADELAAALAGQPQEPSQ